MSDIVDVKIIDRFEGCGFHGIMEQLKADNSTMFSGDTVEDIIGRRDATLYNGFLRLIEGSELYYGVTLLEKGDNGKYRVVKNKILDLMKRVRWCYERD